MAVLKPVPLTPPHCYIVRSEWHVCPLFARG